MFARRKPPTQLDLLIDATLTRMLNTNDMKEYSAAAAQLTVLYKLKEETTSRKRISPDTLILVAGNLIGILMILTHEKVNVISTKAMNHVMKLR